MASISPTSHALMRVYDSADRTPHHPDDSERGDSTDNSLMLSGRYLIAMP
jgi:hypothetical protein